MCCFLLLERQSGLLCRAVQNTWNVPIRNSVHSFLMDFAQSSSNRCASRDLMVFVIIPLANIRYWPLYLRDGQFFLIVDCLCRSTLLNPPYSCDSRHCERRRSSRGGVGIELANSDFARHKACAFRLLQSLLKEG